MSCEYNTDWLFQQQKIDDSYLNDRCIILDLSMAKMQHVNNIALRLASIEA